MKIDQLITQYLYLNKKVTLETIGTFYMSADVDIPSETENIGVLPENAIKFEFNIKAGRDEGLINYIVEQTKKIKPLATSDLESFIILNKQFLNIGKPLILKDLGTLVKNQMNVYEFTQANSKLSKIDALTESIPDKDTSLDVIDFSTPSRKKSKKGLLIPSVISVVMVAILLIVFFIFKSRNNNSSTSIVNDTTSVINKPDSLVNLNTSTSNSSIQIDSVHYYFLLSAFDKKSTIETTLKQLVQKYSNNSFTMYTNDSLQYSVALPIYGLLADSLKVKDSLKLIYGNNISVRLK